MKCHKTKWMIFTEIDRFPGEKRKTKKWVIKSKRGDCLGVVKWHSAWRQYTFFPEKDTLFNRGCIDDISWFLEQIMNERR